MRIIRPEVIDDTTLLSSDVPETEAAYSSGTTYALGDLVRGSGADAHNTFTSLQASNVGHPLRETDGSASLWWLPSGATNRWKMFDPSVQSQTEKGDVISVSLNFAGRVDSVGLLNMSAATAQITVTDTVEGLVYDQTYSLVSSSGITDWYAYFYEPIVRTTDLVVSDLPLYAGSTIDVVLRDTGSMVKCGVLIAGLSRGIGNTQWGASLGIIDYSVKQANDFGDLYVVQRAYSRRASFTLFVQPGLVDELINLLASYRATPILWVGSNAYASMAVYGFYREFAVEVPYPTISQCTLELEGLT